MIKKLQNKDIKITQEIHAIFQVSYAVEAKILKAKNFPPLKRNLKSYSSSSTIFFGYFKNSALAGIIEIDPKPSGTHIHSLVVKPDFFRQGVAGKLMEFVLNTFDSKPITVETGVDNEPACELYRKAGFKEIKQYDTDYGIRKIRFERKN